MILILLIGLQVVHFVTDYCTQNIRILKAKKYGTPLLPILEHAGHHAIGVAFLTSIISIAYVKDLNFAFYATTITLSTHFLIDVLKGKMTKNFPSLDGFDKKGYWVYMGFDQLLHQLVIILIMAIAYKMFGV